ncbi:MAG: metallophosphoesterase [Alphaproteobacteria bacterium]
MPRIAVMSDLHLESGDWSPGPLDADLVILAGDVATGVDGIAWAARVLSGIPVVYVAGNRDYWRHDGDPLESLRLAAVSTPNVRFLQDEAVRFDIGRRGLLVLGCTLWTDFALEGADTIAGVMAEAGATMPDYRNVTLGQGRPLTPEQVLAWHRHSRAWLEGELAQPRNGTTTIVVTHHAPSARSLQDRPPGHVGRITSVSSLDELIADRGPTLWIHGHTHADRDYRLGPTRVVTRQRGGGGNTDYRPLVLDLAE